MKLLFFNDYKLGVLKEGRVVDVTSVLPHVGIIKPEDHMEMVIKDFDNFRPKIEEIMAKEEGVSMDSVKIQAPLPEPHCIYAAFDNYKDIDAPKRPLDFFHKGGVSGNDDTVELADEPLTQCFQPEPELGVIIGKEGKHISEEEAMDIVFGYINIVDVSARPDFKKIMAMAKKGGGGGSRGPGTMFKGKARDGWAPIGPVIATKDELADPHNANVKLWINGKKMQDYSTNLMMHQIPAQIAWLTQFVTLRPGDIISTGTYHIGLSPINDGDRVEIEIEGCEKLGFNIKGFGEPKTENWAPPGPPPKGGEGGSPWGGGGAKGGGSPWGGGAPAVAPGESTLNAAMAQGWGGGGKSAIRDMFMASFTMKKKFGDENVFDLSIMNPVMEPPKEYYEVLAQLCKEPLEGSHRYMLNSGYPETRMAVASNLKKETGLDFEWNNISMTSGCAASLNITLKSTLNPGEEVIISKPFWSDYMTFTSSFKGIPKVVATDENFLPDIATLDEAITTKTKAVIINSPSNPSGAVIPAERLKEIGELLAKKEKEFGHTIFLISDEVYRKIMFDGEKYPFAWEHHPNVIVCTSHSKDLGLAGERIGYVAISPRCEHKKQLASFMENCQRSCGYVSAPATMQHIVAKLQDVTIDMPTYQRQRDTLCDALLNMGYELTPPKGGLCVYPKSPTEDDVGFITELREEHMVLGVGGTVFGTPGYFRISFATTDHDIEGSLKGFQAMADKYIK